MADVLTIVGAKDTEFTSVVRKMVSTVRRAKSEIEAMSINVGGNAGGVGGVGGLGGIGGNPLYAGTGMVGYGNPLYSSVFRNQALVQQMQARFYSGGIASGVGGAGGMGGAGGAGIGGRLTGAGGALGAVAMVGAAVAALNRGLEKIKEMGDQQEIWSRATEKTARQYTQLAAEIGKVYTLSQQARNAATKDAQGKMQEQMDAGTARMEALDGGDGLRRWLRGSVINASAIMSRTPGLNSFMGYEKPGEYYGQQAERTAREAEEKANLAARDGNKITQQAITEAKEKELEAAKDLFITNGRLLNQAAEARQRQEESRAAENAARARSQEMATEDFGVTKMGNEAMVLRLQGREKEARLLEAHAAYKEKHLAIERQINLTVAQRSELQMQEYRIFQLQQKEIETGFSRARTTGIDLSVVGGAAAAMQSDGFQSKMMKEMTEQTAQLKTIAKNTGTARVARFG